MPNQNEYNQALQDLILMNRKKIEIKKVWTNASPTSQFKGQTIKASLKGYEFVLIEHAFSISIAYYTVTLCPVSMNATLKQLSGAQSANTAYMSRDITVSLNGVSFSAGQYKTIASSNAGGTDNAFVIPVNIYGMKGVI